LNSDNGAINNANMEATIEYIPPTSPKAFNKPYVYLEYDNY
jgi:hypothetical protein